MPNKLMMKLSALYQRSREEKLRQFVSLCQLGEDAQILDVGINPNDTNPFENLLERRLADNHCIVGISLWNASPLKEVFPTVQLVQGDGCVLPFSDQSFDAVYSNAVIEHVGDEERQRSFVEECVRVARSGFITTPNFWFPVELHSTLPFVQFLPWSLRKHIFKIVHGPESVEYMRQVKLLSAKRLRSFFPKNVPVRIIKQRVTLYPETLIAYFGRNQ